MQDYMVLDETGQPVSTCNDQQAMGWIMHNLWIEWLSMPLKLCTFLDWGQGYQPKLHKF